MSFRILSFPWLYFCSPSSNLISADKSENKNCTNTVHLRAQIPNCVIYCVALFTCRYRWTTGHCTNCTNHMMCAISLRGEAGDRGFGSWYYHISNVWIDLYKLRHISPSSLYRRILSLSWINKTVYIVKYSDHCSSTAYRTLPCSSSGSCQWCDQW